MIGQSKHELSTVSQEGGPDGVKRGVRQLPRNNLDRLSRVKRSDLRHLSPFSIMSWGLLVDGIGDGVQEGQVMAWRCRWNAEPTGSGELPMSKEEKIR